jgi:hypothetical protein
MRMKTVGYISTAGKRFPATWSYNMSLKGRLKDSNNCVWQRENKVSNNDIGLQGMTLVVLSTVLEGKLLLFQLARINQYKISKNESKCDS